MANSNRVALEELGGAIAKELSLYHRGVQDKVNAAGGKAIRALARQTKATAPYDAQVNHVHFRDLIATKAEPSRLGDTTNIWYVKAPGHRLTHLLVHGHETRDGDRTRADPFLENALASVLPEYENDLKEAIENG